MKYYLFWERSLPKVIKHRLQSVDLSKIIGKIDKLIDLRIAKSQQKGDSSKREHDNMIFHIRIGKETIESYKLSPAASNGGGARVSKKRDIN